MEMWNKNITCNCSVVDGKFMFFCNACGVGLRLRLRFRANWPDSGDNELEFVVIGDVALFDDPELPFIDLRVDGGDLLMRR